MTERFAIQKHGREYAVVDTGFFCPVTIAGHGPSGEREAQRLCRAWNEKGPERRRAELSGRQEDIDLADMADRWDDGWITIEDVAI